LAWLTVACTALAHADYSIDDGKLVSAVVTSLDAAIQHEMVEVGHELFERPEELAISRKRARHSWRGSRLLSAPHLAPKR
jgi:hypothetical protein